MSYKEMRDTEFREGELYYLHYKHFKNDHKHNEQFLFLCIEEGTAKGIAAKFHNNIIQECTKNATMWDPKPKDNSTRLVIIGSNADREMFDSVYPGELAKYTIKPKFEIL